jgi:hypothetical protein
MENVLKQIELPKEVIEVQDAIQQVAEPEPNGYGKDVGILIGGVITLAVLYKLWLKYGKK